MKGDGSSLVTWHTVPSKCAEAKIKRKGLWAPTKLIALGLDGSTGKAMSSTRLLVALDLCCSTTAFLQECMLKIILPQS